MSSLTQRGSARKPKGTGDAEEMNEWEVHSILRVPKELVPKVDWFVKHGRQFDPNVSHPPLESGDNEMAIRFSSNARSGQLKLGDTTVGFKVQDLPCVVETYKTVDKKNIYKVADVSQIIVCSDTPEMPDFAAAIEGDKNDPEVAELLAKREKSLKFPHGLTPPLKNVRRRRFRKTKKMKYMDAPEVEQELKRLLRLDLEASSVSWEVVDYVDKKKKADDGTASASTSKTNVAPDSNTGAF